MAAAKKKKNNKAAKEVVLVTEKTAPAENINADITAPDASVPAEKTVPVPESVSPEETPVTEEAPAPEEAPASEKTPAPEEAPAPEKAPAPEDTLVTQEAPKLEETPVAEETVKPADTVQSAPQAAGKPEPADRQEAGQGKRVIKPAAQYNKSAEREKNIRKQVKKRKRRPVLLILFLCSMLVLVAIIYNSITREPEQPVLPEETAAPIETPPPAEIIVPTPPPGQEAETGVGEEPLPEETPEPPEETPESVVEHSYQFFVEDISWEDARLRCHELGGYLAVITSSDELEEIIRMAEDNGVTHVWLGCHRVDGELVWEGDGDYYYQWDAGEPSAYDYNDNVAEDYLMFWEHNGWWYYNDSRNDPCGDYPAFYSGDMGYVCEFGTN